MKIQPIEINTLYKASILEVCEVYDGVRTQGVSGFYSLVDVLSNLNKITSDYFGDDYAAWGTYAEYEQYTGYLDPREGAIFMNQNFDEDGDDCTDSVYLDVASLFLSNQIETLLGWQIKINELLNSAYPRLEIWAVGNGVLMYLFAGGEYTKPTEVIKRKLIL